MSECGENSKLSKEQAENGEEPSITMVDVLEQEQELEDESAAVLGGSDDKCCTYSKGYIKRQALYSCLTCCPEGRENFNKSAGICLACTYQCHENHELIELYTKRNFRCDCPTVRNAGKKCSFAADDVKLPANEENLYNQNFSGAYCTCKRPYPDPDDPIQDVMAQCMMCEDWYHYRHLDAKVPKEERYSEMICGDCIRKYEFLKNYVGIALKKVESTTENTNVIVSEDDDKLKSDLDRSISDILNMSQASTSNGHTVEVKTEEKMKRKVDEDNKDVDPEVKKTKISNGLDDDCKRPVLDTGYEKGAVFWPDSWRDSLCQCAKCLKMYEELKVTFLLDPEDSAEFYELKGMKNARETVYERGIRALSSMGHTQQIDAITEYNRMKEKLKEYLHTFVVTKKVVTEEDINRFFQEMKNEKNASLGQPYFCR